MDETRDPTHVRSALDKYSTYTTWDQMSRRTDLGEWEWFNSSGQWRPIDPNFAGHPDWPIRVRRKARLTVSVGTGCDRRVIGRGEMRTVIENTLRTGQTETAEELLDAVWEKLTRG